MRDLSSHAFWIRGRNEAGELNRVTAGATQVLGRSQADRAKRGDHPIKAATVQLPVGKTDQMACGVRVHCSSRSSLCEAPPSSRLQL